MREKATEEGIQAEQALRKLAAAAKTGAIRTEKSRLDVLSAQKGVPKEEKGHSRFRIDVRGHDEASRWQRR